MMDLVRHGRRGPHVLFSSHILEEVERVARHIQVIIAGRLAASGGLPRDPAAHDGPGRTVFTIRSSDDRRLATALIRTARRPHRGGGRTGCASAPWTSAGFTWLVPRSPATWRSGSRGAARDESAGERVLLPGGAMKGSSPHHAARHAGRRRALLLVCSPPRCSYWRSANHRVRQPRTSRWPPACCSSGSDSAPCCRSSPSS